MNKINELVKLHNLQPHPEGGYFKETYRSDYSTGIFYLLLRGQKSSLHRIQSDEMWHFYDGDAICVVELSADGKIKETRLDKSHPQYVVPAGVWFGAYLPEDSNFAFTGCTVAPAFHFKDFELADKSKLLKEFPEARMIIEKL